MTITIPPSTASYTLSASGTTASNAGTRGQSGSGASVGIYLQGSNDTLVNTGTIFGGSTGSLLNVYAGVAVKSGTGDSVINQAGGLIENTYTFAAGVLFYLTPGTVTNAGTIIGGVGVAGHSGNGVDLDAGGSVTNLATGTISGGGVYSGKKGGAGTVTNSGKIIGSSFYGGIYLADGGMVTNLAGTIAANGPVYGIKIAGGAGTITNAATITAGSASGVGIVMASGFANRVIDESGGVFVGTVNGGSNATMELASSASAGTLTATSGQFTNFSGLYIDSGARWTIKGDAGLSSEFGTISGFTVGDTISLTGLAQTPTTFSSSVTVNSGTATTSVIIKAGATNLETLTLAGSIASSALSFSAGATSTLTEPAAAPVVTAGATVTFDGGGAAVAADSGLTVTDSGSSTLVSATVTIGGFISGDTLTVGDLNSLTPSFSSGTLTLTGTASLATYEAALDSVDYGFTANGDPTGGGSHTSRTLSWSVNDGTSVSNTATSTVDTVHTAPSVTAGANVTFVQGGSPVTLDSGLVVTDPDSGGVLNSATISVAGGVFSTDGDTLSANTAGTGISASYTQSDETLVLTGTGVSLSVYQSVLRSVALSSTGATAGPRTIDWTVNDGVDSSTTATSMATVHDKPVVTAGATATFHGGGAPVAADPGLTVSDASSSNLVSATVVIGGFITGDTLTVGTLGGLTPSFTNGTLTLSGTATLTTYQTALDSIDYGFAAGGDPTGGGSHTSRTLSWTINDGTAGSNTGTSTVDTVHTAPTVVAGGTATYVGGGSPVALDPGLTATDVDSGNVLSSATITIGSAISGDALNFTNLHPSTEGNVSIQSNSGGTLVLTSSGSTATVLQWETALESVTYSSSNADPTAGGTADSRTIGWTINDGVAVSGASTSTLDLKANVTPVITGISPDTGTSSTDGITDTGALTVDGTASSGTTIDVFSGTTLIATGTTGSLGTWSATLGTPLSPGDYTLTAFAIQSGVTSTVSPGFAVDVDETAPTVISDDIAGSSPNNASSDQFTVVFSEAVSGVTASSFSPAETNTVTGTISGVTGSGTTYTVTVGGVAGDGTLGLNLKAAGANGIEDTAGNEPAAYSAGQTYTIEHTPPSVTAIDTVGSSSNTGGTEQFTVAFSEAVTGVDTSDFSLADTGTVSGTIGSISGIGNSYTVTVTGATGAGTMGLDLNPSGTGITDAAGNPISGGFTNGETFTITPAAPATFDAHVYTDSNGDGSQDNGESNLANVPVNLLDSSGNLTGQSATTDSNGNVSFTGLTPGIYEIGVVTPAGDGVSQATNTNTPNTLTAGETANATEGVYVPATFSVFVYDDVNANGTFDTGDTDLSGQSVALLNGSGVPTGQTTTTNASGIATFTGLAPGGYEVSVTTAGGDVVSQSTNIDTPNTLASGGSASATLGEHGAPTVTEVLANDTGGSNSDGVTSDPEVTGTGDANAVVTLSEGGTTLATTTADATGAWNYTPTLPDGVHTIVASETDGAGTGTASLTFTLDTTAPTVTETFVTNTTTPALTGGGDGNATVTLTSGGATIGTATANALGAWTASPSLTAGTYTVVASETDLAGNTGSASVTFTLVTAPSVTVTGGGNTVYVPAGGSNSIALGTGTDNTLVVGNGNDTITGNASGDTISGGSGNVSISGLTGGATINLGSGNDTITITGAGNNITVGTGTDHISAGTGGNETVVAGDGTNTISAGGTGDSITAGNGTNKVTASGAGATISLGNGTNTVGATAAGDTITTGTGNDTISATAGSAIIRAGLGTNTIKFAGSGNTIINQGGTDTLTDTGTDNTIALPLAGQGEDIINGSVLSNGDSFDLRAAMAATTWDQQISDLGSYLTLGTSGGNALVQLSVTAGGTPITIAILNGAGSVSLSSFQSHALLT